MRLHVVRRAFGTAAIVVALAVAAAACTKAEGHRVTPSGAAQSQAASSHVAALADSAAVPPRWAPLGYRGAQIAVPASWFVENPGTICGGHDAGRVFIDEPATVTAGMECGPAANTVVLRRAGSSTLPHAHSTTVNGIPATIGSVRNGGHVVHLERALGVDISSTGPVAVTVLKTLTHSALSVVLRSTHLPTPSGWRHVSFGGLTFAVPASWRTDYSSGWGGCPFNLAPAVLQLNTARTVSAPSCPAPPSTAGAIAGVAGMVIAAGPRVPREAATAARCRQHNGLRLCIDPEPLHGGYAQAHGLEILTALVYVPAEPQPTQIEIGLSGSGLLPAEVFDSIHASE